MILLYFVNVLTSSEVHFKIFMPYWLKKNFICFLQSCVIVVNQLLIRGNYLFIWWVKLNNVHLFSFMSGYFNSLGNSTRTEVMYREQISLTCRISGLEIRNEPKDRMKLSLFFFFWAGCFFIHIFLNFFQSPSKILGSLIR